MSLCFLPNSLARQRTLEDEEEQQRERRRRHRSLLSSTSTDEEAASPAKDTSPASSRSVGSCCHCLAPDSGAWQLLLGCSWLRRAQLWEEMCSDQQPREEGWAPRRGTRGNLSGGSPWHRSRVLGEGWCQGRAQDGAAGGICSR